jgi:hypothetical protein
MPLSIVGNLVFAAFVITSVALAKDGADSPVVPQDDQLAVQVSRLVHQLNDDMAARRDSAEQ